jgi:cytochrome c oxidase assembly protein subunit 11
VEFERSKANRKLTRSLWLFALGSFGFGFALVPLYDVICDLTGYGDRSQLLQAAEAKETEVIDRSVAVEFISTATAAGDWELIPNEPVMNVQPGRFYDARFVARNLRTQAATAQAIPSIAPNQATRYFQKTECFCFTPQAFEPMQEREFVVRFMLDPQLPGKIDRLTLAYAMYDVAAGS